MDNYILEYYQQIKDGSVLVGKWIKMLYECIVHGIEDGLYVYDAKKADRAIKWIEKYCHHTEGEKAPDHLRLELWQKALLACMFGLCDPKNGKRQFREVFLVVGRKNGKSLFASAIANYIFFEDGGFGARVYCVAPKLDQADIIYNDIWTMITQEPELMQQKDIPLEAQPNTARHRMTDLYIESSNSTVKKIAFSAKKSDGFNPSLCICDEVASWQGDAGLKQYEVMKSGMGARPEGIMLACTTSGYQNDSIFDELLKRSTRFLLGESKETRLLPFLYMIDDIDKWNDINELRKANPNLGVSIPVDYLLEEIAIAEGSLSKKVEFITKYCCQKQNSSTAWLSTQTVAKCMTNVIQLADFAHSYCVAGIDLSQTTDLTSACVVIERKGKLYVFSKCWLPSERIDEATERDGVPYRIYIERGLVEPSGDNFVDYHDCYNWLVNLVEQYEILPLAVGYDRYSAQYLIQDLTAYGFNCDSVFQGDNLWGTLQLIEGEMKDGNICIGSDNDLMKTHLLNSAIKMSVERGRGRLVKVSPTAHIDSVAALADAMVVREKWWPDIGGRLKNER